MHRNTHTQTWLFSTVSLWLSVFCERPDSLFGVGQTHRGRYTMLMSQSGLNTQKPLNTTLPLIRSSAAVRWQPELNLKCVLALQIFGKSNRVTGTQERARTRQTENEIMRQMRTHEDRRCTERGERTYEERVKGEAQKKIQSSNLNWP